MSFFWKPYVSVAERRAKAKKQLDKLRKKEKIAIRPGMGCRHSFEVKKAASYFLTSAKS